MATKEAEAKVPVPETKRKRISVSNRRKEIKRKAKVASIKKSKLARIEAYHKAEKYEAEYHRAERLLISQRRQAKQGGTSFFVEPEPKVLLVIRIRGINGVSPKVRKILQLLRLRQVHNAVFVRVNKPILNMLKLVEPFITYGSPSVKAVRSLIYKRGYGKINGQRIPLQNNKLISDNLGTLGVTCMEDLVHEIFTCGPNFKEVNRFLWTFKLSSPRGGYVRKAIAFSEGGDAGDREQYINKLVSKMN